MISPDSYTTDPGAFYVNNARTWGEPPPAPNDEPGIHDSIIKELESLTDDLRSRRDFGLQKYATYLQPFNGRDAGVDIEEELWDALVYARQQRIEHNRVKEHFLTLFRAVSDALGFEGFPTVEKFLSTKPETMVSAVRDRLEAAGRREERLTKSWDNDRDHFVQQIQALRGSELTFKLRHLAYANWFKDDATLHPADIVKALDERTKLADSAMVGLSNRYADLATKFDAVLAHLGVGDFLATDRHDIDLDALLAAVDDRLATDMKKVILDAEERMTKHLVAAYAAQDAACDELPVAVIDEITPATIMAIDSVMLREIGEGCRWTLVPPTSCDELWDKIVDPVAGVIHHLSAEYDADDLDIDVRKRSYVVRILDRGFTLVPAPGGGVLKVPNGSSSPEAIDLIADVLVHADDRYMGPPSGDGPYLGGLVRISKIVGWPEWERGDRIVDRLVEEVQKQMGVIDYMQRRRDEAHAAFTRMKGDLGLDETTWDHLASEVEMAVVDRDRFKDDYARACNTIARMHEAATGRSGEAPVRGVVEDLADVRSKYLTAKKLVEDITAAVNGHRNGPMTTPLGDVAIMKAAFKAAVDREATKDNRIAALEIDLADCQQREAGGD